MGLPVHTGVCETAQTAVLLNPVRFTTSVAAAETATGAATDETVDRWMVGDRRRV